MSLKLRLSALAAAAALAVGLVTAAPVAAVTISNSPTGGSIGSFGIPDTMTYGQVFTAPVTGTLDSFTLFLNGDVGNVVGAVGSWNGSASHGYNFGSPLTHYASAPVSSEFSPLTFVTGGTSVVAGNLYVAFLTVFGLGNAPAITTMPSGTDAPGLNYFVWNNTSDPFGNSSWNYFSNLGNALFEANFTAASNPAPIPLPAAGWMLIAGLGGLAALRRRRKSA
ncbi:VPLPA-CTERM protein sorting domain-containing protein [Gemmobacter megaterium]|uniref:VPLPA-CTERM protein sorting domain-containing protein n=1 Tax=Gemmobacter megaterium TaxID=1086013 RepID=A0A1N7QF48_9RHOB|nr:VPLPA-CTERM sorting domain-containing protein [Gemmobacter megaterium]GGE25889.1 hypothetical protein GCM10011345_34830 [Gemmobacter megaterium]SIT21480.1 VPLPA-CTERM protein sorting domain-containing protein [Gemmobacter megaterium]